MQCYRCGESFSWSLATLMTVSTNTHPPDDATNTAEPNVSTLLVPSEIEGRGHQDHIEAEDVPQTEAADTPVATAGINTIRAFRLMPSPVNALRAFLAGVEVKLLILEGMPDDI